MDDTSYFANYEKLLKAKEESIVLVISGTRAVYRSTTALEKILSRYAAPVGPQTDEANAESAARPPCWIDIQYPTVESMVLISRALGIHTLTMEDCLSETEDQHQKNELFDTYRFLSFTEFHYIPYTNVLGSVDVHIIVPEQSNIILSLHNGPALFMATTLRALSTPRNALGFMNMGQPHRDHSHVSSYQGGSQGLNGTGDHALNHDDAALSIEEEKLQKAHPICVVPSAYWMMYSIMDSIVDRFVHLVATCTNEVEQLDSLVLDLPAREQTDLLLRIGEVRKQISLLRLQLMRKQDILHTIVAESKDAALMQEHTRTIIPPSALAPSPSAIIHSPTPISAAEAAATTSASSHLLQTPTVSSPSIAARSPPPVGGGGGATQTHPTQLPYANRISTIRIFLRDILDHVNSMLYDLEQDKETLLNLTNAYQARVSIEMNLAAAEQNQVMKKFSAMATIILPLTFVPSLWGMNVPVPGQGASSTWAFWTIVASLVGAGIIATFVFWRIKWL